MLKVIRDARVKCSVVWNETPELVITINDRYSHQFPATSRESKLLMVMDLDSINILFDKGTYIVYNENLIDYRSADYKGFIHNDDGIKQLQDLIGIEQKSNNVFSRAKSKNGVYLGGSWDKFDLEIPELGIGGEFTNSINFKWSPFSRNVITSLDIERLICSNGMVAMSPVVTREAPLINVWSDNLNVITNQLKPIFSDVLSTKIRKMVNSRASVADTMLCHDTLKERLFSDLYKLEEQEQAKLYNLVKATDVKAHLSKYYKEKVFEDNKASKVADSHLSEFTIYNILTETMTHYGENEGNDNKIQMMLNRMMFDEAASRKHSEIIVPDNINNDHRTAFFAED